MKTWFSSKRWGSLSTHIKAFPKDFSLVPIHLGHTSKDSGERERFQRQPWRPQAVRNRVLRFIQLTSKNRDLAQRGVENSFSWTDKQGPSASEVFLKQHLDYTLG